MAVVPFFWAPEPLQFGDQVEFHIGRRTYDRLSFALDIRVVQKAQDIRFKVRIAHDVPCIRDANESYLEEPITPSVCVLIISLLLLYSMVQTGTPEPVVF